MPNRAFRTYFYYRGGPKRNISSDASGNYTFVNILPGHYRIEGEKTGF